MWSDSSLLNLNHSVENKSLKHVTYTQFCIFRVTYKPNKIKGSFITHLFLEAYCVIESGLQRTGIFSERIHIQILL